MTHLNSVQIQLPIKGIKLNIVELPQIEATFPGGNSSLKSFISRACIYPQEAFENGIDGKVYAEIEIDQTGKIINRKILESPSELLSQEFLRIIDLMPPWFPAKNDGEPVYSKLRIGMNFMIV